jgi:hypothetical protein
MPENLLLWPQRRFLALLSRMRWGAGRNSGTSGSFIPLRTGEIGVEQAGGFLLVAWHQMAEADKRDLNRGVAL